MNVKNCRKCGKIFNYISGPIICPACQEKQEEEFQKVKEYIRSNPGCTLVQTAKDCEVEANLIKQWVKEERLEFTGGGATDITCEKCGKAIFTGRFCDDCKKELGQSLSDTADSMRPKKKEPPKKPESSGNKMRFLR